MVTKRWLVTEQVVRVESMRRVKRAVSLWVVCCLAVLVGSGLADTPAAEDAGWKASDPMIRAVNRGVMLMEQYQYGAAAEAFGEAVKLSPKSVEARVNLAIARYNRSEKGDIDEANRLLDQVLAEQPDNARALYFRGIVCQYTGKDEEAITYFRGC